MPCRPLLGRTRHALLVLLFAVLLPGLLPAPAQAVSLTLTVNQSQFSTGQTLSLSAGATPSNDAGRAVDLYLALVLPSGTLLTLDSQSTWQSSLTPLLRNWALSAVQANDFYRLALPTGLPGGSYGVYLIAVASGNDPTLSSNWLASANTSFSFSSSAANPVSLTTVNATCTVNQACNVPLVAAVSGGSTPYHFAQDSLAYGTRPLNTNIDLLTGNLVGTPSQAGSYPFRLCAIDLGGNQNCQNVTVTVNAAPAPGNLRVFIGGSVATFATVTLDGSTVLKDASSANLSTYQYLSAGQHTLTVRCTEVYCFAYLQIDAPSGYTASPASFDFKPADIPPGTEKTVTFTLAPQ